MIQRRELATFLRARREATDPAAVGLPRGSRRRTPGLRREELAQLSGVSVTWYTWLEQAREIGVSRQVVEAIGRALRLGRDDRDVLFTLAGMALPSGPPEPPRVNDTLARLVQTLQPNPAYVANVWWDVLACNDMYAELLGGFDERPAPERNILWLTFTQKRSRNLFVDWETEARQLVGQFRINLAQHPNDPRGGQLRTALLDASPRFAELWQEQTARRFEPSRKQLRHERLGVLHLDYVKLDVAEQPDLAMLVFLPADEKTAGKLGSRFVPYGAVHESAPA
ncbi:helix-turn-helix transcriptional regulator [Promicromonospora sukumoe]|uniref:helix-turn-helix transcriptional regulator n=1 Tax=Promicromonospora sukumoe TaxID=88382 RepID=UPI001E5954F5|nr:helix-turn-helix transcriptional regulator [Promicromonospora sukumoe]